MKSFALGLILAAFPGLLFCADDAQLSDVHSVYLLSMGSGLDQYLANRLTSGDIFLVVTDPVKADAVFTDKLGDSFQQQLDELYKPKPAPKDSKKDDKAEAKKGGNMDEKPEVPRSTFSRGKGTIFLVDAKTHAVIWSTYERPKNSSADEMNRIAGKISDRLKHDLEKK